MTGLAMRSVLIARGLLSTILAIASTGVITACGGPVPKEYRPQEKVQTFSNADWQKVLDAVCTEDGFVRYEPLEYNENNVQDALLRYVGLINAVSPENRPDLFASSSDSCAYYLNAYNALCMYGVLKKGLPDNVLTSGLYFLNSFPVGGVNMTLDKLEKTRIRSVGDPRVHFALNCMSRSCPPLRREPYEGSKLDAQLDEQAQRFLSDSRGAQRDGDQVKISEIFRFYEDEFLEAARQRSGNSDISLLESIQPYAAPPSPVLGATGYTFMKYDWSLNRARR
jgi:hypothetical protein